MLEARIRHLAAGPGRTTRTPRRWNYDYADGRGRVGIIASVTRPFCQQCNRLRLTADGKLRNCLFALDEVDVRPFLRDSAGRRGACSELIRQTVWEKWEGHEINIARFVKPDRERCTQLAANCPNLVGIIPATGSHNSTVWTSSPPAARHDPATSACRRTAGRVSFRPASAFPWPTEAEAGPRPRRDAGPRTGDRRSSRSTTACREPSSARPSTSPISASIATALARRPRSVRSSSIRLWGTSTRTSGSRPPGRPRPPCGTTRNAPSPGSSCTRDSRSGARAMRSAALEEGPGADAEGAAPRTDADHRPVAREGTARRHRNGRTTQEGSPGARRAADDLRRRRGSLVRARRHPRRLPGRAKRRRPVLQGAAQDQPAAPGREPRAGPLLRRKQTPGARAGRTPRATSRRRRASRTPSTCKRTWRCGSASGTRPPTVRPARSSWSGSTTRSRA